MSINTGAEMPSKKKVFRKVSRKEQVPQPVAIGPTDQFAVDENFLALHYGEIVKNVITKYVVWSPVEAGWLRMKDEAATAPHLPLRLGLANMLRKSFGGCFIKYMNKAESTTFEVTEKKMEIAQIMSKLNERPIVDSRLNDYTENIQKYLQMTVNDSRQKNGWISQKMFLGNLPTLRLCYQKITQMDDCLRRYDNLLAIILTANYIEDFHGKYLPPMLNMLELFGNLMYDIVKLTEDAPHFILYLGIGRNYLYKIVNLSLLERFQHLYFLDLSENDFEDLKEVLNKIAGLPNVKYLSLEGNPCSVPVSYVHIVQRMCPQVDYLDGIKFVKDAPMDETKDDYQGVMQIHGISFFRVPPPTIRDSKHEKTDKFYQLEFEIPLLDPALWDFEGRSIKRSEMGVEEPEVPPAVTKGLLSFETGSFESTKRSSKSAERNPETSELREIEKTQRSYLRWLNRDKETPTTTTFLSSKVHHWTKIMRFPSPSIEIPVNQKMWRRLRDSMRSVIIMRLYYKEEPVLVVRNLLAKIPVPVEVPKWNLPFMGYTWDIKERCFARRYPGVEKIKYSGSFRGQRKSLTPGKRQSRASSAGQRKSRASSAGKRKSRASSTGKRKSKAGGKRQSKMSSGGQRKSKMSTGGHRKSKMSAGGQRKSRMSTGGGGRKSIGGKSATGTGKRKAGKMSDKYPLPDILTCHIGVGLKRLGKEAPSEDKSKRNKSRQSRASRKSKQPRKSQSARKSEAGRASRKSMKKKQSIKRQSRAGNK